MADAPSRRSRSRSPPRKAPRGSRGFRWKDSRPRDSGNERRDYSDRRRDYRERSRSPRGSRNPGRDGDRDRDRYRDRESDRPRDSGRDGDRDGDEDRPRSPRRTEATPTESVKPEGTKKPKKEKKDKKPSAAAIAAGQELIVVNVNDRLGTKTAVPCLPGDTIGQLKLMIAARIGRDAGQIMLRRQGERPFKNMISLEDYGISNGVQLDLEIDTGD